MNRDDLIVNITFAWEGAIAHGQTGRPALFGISRRFPSLRSTIEQRLILAFVKSHRQFASLIFPQLALISPGGARAQSSIEQKGFPQIDGFCCRHLDEQKRLAEVMGAMDLLIATRNSRCSQPSRSKSAD